MYRPTALLLGVVTVLLGLAVAPSSADPGHTIGFSRDGRQWSDNLGAPLFDPNILWVPGDVREARFFVRNERPDDGRLRLTVQDSSQDALRESRYLRVAAKVGDAPWDAVTAPGRQVLADRLRIRGDDQAVEVRVRVRFLEDAPNVTMYLPTDLGFRVVLSDATAVAAAEGAIDDPFADDQSIGETASGAGASNAGDGPGATGGSAGTSTAGGATTTSVAAPDALEAGADSTGSTSWLPATGSMVPGWLTPAALLVMGVGAVLLARRRPEPAFEDVVDEVPRG